MTRGRDSTGLHTDPVLVLAQVSWKRETSVTTSPQRSPLAVVRSLTFRTSSRVPIGLRTDLFSLTTHNKNFVGQRRLVYYKRN